MILLKAFLLWSKQLQLNLSMPLFLNGIVIYNAMDQVPFGLIEMFS